MLSKYTSKVMRLGKFQIPDLGPREGLRFAKVIYDFPDHKVSYLGFTEKCGIKPEGSGYPGQILLTLKLYGLAEANDELKTTPLAEQLIIPKNDEEYNQAKQTLFNRIGLWTILREHFGDDVKESDFWVYLSEIEGIKGTDRQEVQKKAPRIRKSYIQAVQFLKTAEKLDLAPQPRALGRRDRTTKRTLEQKDVTQTPDESVSIGSGTVGRISVSDGYIDVKDETSYEIAKGYLKLMAKRLGIQE